MWVCYSIMEYTTVLLLDLFHQLGFPCSYPWFQRCIAASILLYLFFVGNVFAYTSPSYFVQSPTYTYVHPTMKPTQQRHTTKDTAPKHPRELNQKCGRAMYRASLKTSIPTDNMHQMYATVLKKTFVAETPNLVIFLSARFDTILLDFIST